MEVSNECGSETDSIVVDVCESEFLIPNAFSPNNDGLNDILELIKIGDPSLIDFSIFNRWGQKIFETHDDAQGWDGTYKNKEQGIGVYVFILKYFDEETGSEHFLAGNITLLR